MWQWIAVDKLLAQKCDDVSKARKKPSVLWETLRSSGKHFRRCQQPVNSGSIKSSGFWWEAPFGGEWPVDRDNPLLFLTLLVVPKDLFCCCLSLSLFFFKFSFIFLLKVSVWFTLKGGGDLRIMTAGSIPRRPDTWSQGLWNQRLGLFSFVPFPVSLCSFASWHLTPKVPS